MPGEAARIPVAIVGGGPVGLALALMLDRLGIRCVLFNSEATTRWHPKGGSQGARTMEHYRALGIAGNIRRLGLPPDQPTDVVYLTRFGGYELARLRMRSAAQKARDVESAAAIDQVPEPLHRANQMYVEKFLLEHAATRPNIKLRFGWQVEDFAEGADGVTLGAVRGRDGAHETWRAQYLAGSDGGQGIVRRALGIRYAGGEALQQKFLGGRMFSTYVRVPELGNAYLKNDRAFQYWLLNPQFRTAIISLNGDDEFMIWTRPSGPDGVFDDRIVLETIRRATHAGIAVEIIASHPWTAGIALVAESYGTGRVLLAGDSAHLFTPTGGFGMNTGIDDAANLAWKLAARVQGWGGPALLASYERERRPIAVRNTGAARELGKSIGSVETPVAMEDDSSAGEAARRQVGAVLADQTEQYGSLGVQLGVRYDGSPLIAEDGAAPTDDFVNYRPSSVPGGRAPHFWLGNGRAYGDSLFDRLGPGFTLLRLGDRPPDTSDLAAAAAAAAIPIKILDVPAADARDLYGCDLALIRPDHHVAWRGNRPPPDPAALMSKITGH